MRNTTTHIWMHDGRSLCDRQSDVRSRPRTSSGWSDEELRAFLADQAAPACGPCLLVAAYVRRLAVELLGQSGGRVHPSAPSAGWAQLRDTRWAARLDLEELLARPELDTTIRYHAIGEAEDQQQRGTLPFP